MDLQDLRDLLDPLEVPLDHQVDTLAILAGVTRDILAIEDRVHQDLRQAMEATMEATRHLPTVEATLQEREALQDPPGPPTLRVTGAAVLPQAPGPIPPTGPASPPAQARPTVHRTPGQENILLLLLLLLLTRDTVRPGQEARREARDPTLLLLPANTRVPQPLPGPPRYITDSSLTARVRQAPGQDQGMNQRRLPEEDSPAVRMDVPRVQSPPV